MHIMILEGDHTAIAALKEKKYLMDSGLSHDHIRPALFIGAGLMKGVYAVGAMMAFEEMGFRNVFSEVVALSSGAPTGAYFLAGQAAVLPDVITQDVTSSKLIRPWHLRNVVNLEYLVSVLSGSTGRGIDLEILFASPTDFQVAVSEFATAQPWFIRPDTPARFMDTMRATVAIPGIVTQRVYIDDVRCVDGASAEPYALTAAYDQSKATHIIVIMNQDKAATHSPRSEKIASTTFWRHRFSRPLLKAANARHAARGAFAAHAISGNTATAIVWGDERIGSYERSGEELSAAMEASYSWWKKILATGDNTI